MSRIFSFFLFKTQHFLSHFKKKSKTASSSSAASDLRTRCFLPATSFGISKMLLMLHWRNILSSRILDRMEIWKFYFCAVPTHRIPHRKILLFFLWVLKTEEKKKWESHLGLGFINFIGLFHSGLSSEESRTWTWIYEVLIWESHRSSNHHLTLNKMHQMIVFLLTFLRSQVSDLIEPWG